MQYIVASAGVVLVMLMAGAGAAQPGATAAEVCKKMIADGRGGRMTQTNCLCAYHVAETVLDANVQALLFESWRNGTNNTAAMDALPNRGRILRQFQTMKRTVEKNCPGFPAG